MAPTFVRFIVRFVLATCLHGLLSRRLSVVAFAIQPSPPTDSSGITCNINSGDAPVIDVSEARERIGSGRVYVHHNFLSDEQLRWLSDDMSELEREGKFVTNGLSDTRKGLKGEHAASSTASSKADQGFSVKYDRSVCPIPWWRETLRISEVPSNKGPTRDQGGLASIQSKLDLLRRGLSETMGRPTMLKNDLDHECYYSKSAPGSSLARHMDERHEETKGPRGWLLPSRRSLSWLIYLSETDDGSQWDYERNGGLLRSFPQPSTTLGRDSHGGSHNGNLQVGWLLSEGSKSRPVYLNSWHDHLSPYSGTNEPHCILYTTRGSKDDDIEYITAPWSIDALAGGNVATFMQSRARLESSQNTDESLFLSSKYASQFHLLEDRESWSNGDVPRGSIVEDYLPTRGTLVVFDSVLLPHEVTAVVEGRRKALAGWFHESTQPLGGGTPT